jgi:hypothetical protein
LEANVRKFLIKSRLPILAACLQIPLSLAMVAQAQEARDPSYRGSSFNEILNVVEDQGFVPRSSDEQEEFNFYRSGQLPQYHVNYFSLGGAILHPLFGRSEETLDQRADSYPYFKKYVHANGICVVGKWEIKNPTPFSGYFRQGASGLFLGRISVALQETTRAGNRGFGFAGKIFPTNDANAVVPTTNFFTVDELSGTPSLRFLDVSLTNDPPLIPSLDLTGELAKIIPAFVHADSSPTFRPVTQIARMGMAAPVRSPIWMRLRPAGQVIKNNQPDFRREVMQAMEDNNGLTFFIDTSTTSGDRKLQSAWKQVGTITVNRAIESFGCDRRLHFSHPRDDKSNQLPK